MAYNKLIDLNLLNEFLNKIKNLFATKDIATQTTNGLLSAEDKIKIDNSNQNNTETSISPRSVATFEASAAGMPLKGLTVDIEPVQAGSGDPSPDNVRPISGWTGANVMIAGKNLIDANTVWAAFLQPDGTFYHPLGNVHFYIPQELVGKQLTFSAYAEADANNANLRVCAVIGGASRNGNLINNMSEFSLTQLTFTPTSTSDYIVLQNSGINGIYKNIQLELASTATAYEPYNADTYHITFPTSAGTVYGGTLDVTSGVLTVDRAMVDLATLNWAYNTTYAFFTSASLTNRAIGVNNVKSDLFKTSAGSWSGTPSQNAIWGNGSNAIIYVQIPPYDNVADFVQLVAGHQLVYYLDTPIEITLTPTQIETLLGQNSIWADCGDVEVKYGAYIEIIQQEISNLKEQKIDNDSLKFNIDENGYLILTIE